MPPEPLGPLRRVPHVEIIEERDRTDLSGALADRTG